MDGFVKRLAMVLASRKFFVFVIALLVFQATWLALSFSYAMLWDEYFHFGLIQFYAQHLNPFITSQPHSADIYGEIAYSPSWLYHYLMSFPYRLISVFTHDQTIQIIILRFINIALFAAGLVAFRAALLRVTKSKALAHFVLFILVLFPLSSLLAAQVNYDNLQFLLTGLIFYWAIGFVKAKRFSARELILAIGVGLLACVVKYTFLPIFVALIVFLTYWLIKKYRGSFWSMLGKSFGGFGLASKLGLVVLLVVGAGLFVEDYGTNFIKYHSVNPACEKVLSVERCMSYSPYARNYKLKHRPDKPQTHGPLVFAGTEWFPRLFNQYFSTGTRLSYANYTVKKPLPIPYITGLVITALGVLCVILRWRIFKRPEVQLIVLAMLALAGALWLLNYGGYLRNGEPTAVQGRYLLPLVPFGLLLGGIAASQVLKNWRVRSIVTVVAILGLVAGGGLITHIERSNPRWYWHNQTVISLNGVVRDGLDFLKL